LTIEQIIKSAKEGKFKVLYDDIDKLIESLEQQIQSQNKIKFTVWMHELCATNTSEYWADKMNPAKCRKLFDKFLVLYEKAHGEPYDSYEPATRTYHFENFKAYMMWKYRHFLESKDD